jgi:hypothetical protein
MIYSINTLTYRKPECSTLASFEVKSGRSYENSIFLSLGFRAVCGCQDSEDRKRTGLSRSNRGKGAGPSQTWAARPNQHVPTLHTESRERRAVTFDRGGSAHV